MWTRTAAMGLGLLTACSTSTSGASTGGAGASSASGATSASSGSGSASSSNSSSSSLSSSGAATTSSCKRGLAYGGDSPADQAAAVPGIGWWYNWSSSPESAVQATYAGQGLEFVPMVWGASFDVATVESQIPAGAKYLLAFNEPNFVSQSNLTPQAAAALWPKLEQIAHDRNLALVSPAVNFCGPASACINQDTSPFDWLDQFFAACPKCQVDYVAVHIYLQDGAGLKNVLMQYESKYPQPIWLTEFANLGSSVSAADELTFVSEALPLLEADPRVFRYAWFTGRSDGQPSLDLFGPDAGALTPLGQTYLSGASACTP